jgi:hypothetical protein
MKKTVFGLTVAVTVGMAGLVPCGKRGGGSAASGTRV